MTILPQEVWFADFPFADDETQSKKRPVVVLDVDDENFTVLSLKITSRPPYSEFEIEIYDWAEIPLKHLSTVDAASARQLPKSNFIRKLGRLSNDDWDNVTDLFVSYQKSQGII